MSDLEVKVECWDLPKSDVIVSGEVAQLVAKLKGDNHTFASLPQFRLIGKIQELYDKINEVNKIIDEIWGKGYGYLELKEKLKERIQVKK